MESGALPHPFPNCFMKCFSAPLAVFILLLSACGNHEPQKNTPAHISLPKPLVVCDNDSLDIPPVNKHSITLSVWLEDSSLEWFLDKRQSAWREAKAWGKKIIPIDSNALLKCIAAERKDLFLHIPNHFYKKDKGGNEYFRFFIVNNSADSVSLPMIDAVIDNISSSVRIDKNDSAGNWLSFQQTGKIVECGNSFHTVTLPPQTAVTAEIESQFLNLGDAGAGYRIELSLNSRKIVSNTIGIHLMPQQLPYLGKTF